MNIRRVVYSVALSMMILSMDAQQVRKFNFQCSDLIYSHSLGHLIGTGRSPYLKTHEFGLFIIDPVSGDHEIVYEFHDVLLDLALSHDSKLLYVATHNLDSSIIIFDLPDFTIRQTFRAAPVGANSFNIQALAVSREDPELIAMVRRIDSERSMAMYYKGAELPNVIDGRDIGYSLVFSDTYLYTNYNGQIRVIDYDYDGAYLRDGFYFTIDNVPLNLIDDMIYGGGADISKILDDSIAYVGRMGYRTYLERADPIDFFSAMVDTLNNQAIYINEITGDVVVIIFDLETMTYKDEFLVEDVTSNSPFDRIGKCVYVGAGAKFAFYDNDFIYLAQYCSSKPPRPSWSPTYEHEVHTCDKKALYPPAGVDKFYTPDGLLSDSFLIQYNTHSFRVADSLGCLSDPSLPLKINFSRYPDKPVIHILDENGRFNPGMQTTRCQNGLAYLKVSGLEDDELAIWSSGDTASVIATNHSGAISVHIKNIAGCASEESEPVQIIEVSAKDTVPPKIVDQDGNVPKYFCDNATRLYLTSSTPYKALRWIRRSYDYSGQRLIVSGISYPSENILVQGLSADGCWTGFGQVAIKNSNRNTPAGPRIEMSDGILKPSIQGFNYQWYKDGEPIRGANGPVFVSTGTGAYTVKVHDGICWSEVSREFYVP